MNTPPITAQKVISTPTDRSMPEVMMTKVLATASTPITVVDCIMPMMLSSVMKASGLSTLNTTISAIRLAKASSFCLAWPSRKRASQEGEEEESVIGIPVFFSERQPALRRRAGSPAPSGFPAWRRVPAPRR